ncbi:unnamed protein product [Arctogadus glacialis]
MRIPPRGMFKVLVSIWRFGGGVASTAHFQLPTTSCVPWEPPPTHPLGDPLPNNRPDLVCSAWPQHRGGGPSCPFDRTPQRMGRVSEFPLLPGLLFQHWRRLPVSHINPQLQAVQEQG